MLAFLAIRARTVSVILLLFLSSETQVVSDRVILVNHSHICANNFEKVDSYLFFNGSHYRTRRYRCEGGLGNFWKGESSKSRTGWAERLWAVRAEGRWSEEYAKLCPPDLL